MKLSDLHKNNELTRSESISRGQIETRQFVKLRKEYPFYGYAEVVTTYCDPFVMFCNNDEVFSYVANWNKNFAYEERTLALWAGLCRQAEHIADVGAHVGLFSLIASLSNKDAVINSFEAIDHIFARLFVNVQANRLPRVRPHLLAASDQSAWIDINIRSGPHFLSTGASISDRGKTIGTHKVKAVTLDEFFDGDRLDLMKIDVEDHEPQVVRGGINTINKYKPLLIAEVLSEDMLQEIKSILSPLGYKAYWVSESDGQLIDTLNERPIRSRNIVLNHPECRVKLSETLV